MHTLKNILVFLVLSSACLIDSNRADSSNDGNGQQLVSDQCTKCICLARTGCKTEDKCTHTEKYSSCGWLQITEPFWTDADFPVVKGDNKLNDKAFDRCAMNYECSVRALRAYMKRYQKDCNGDGVIDCKDFAAIHMAGAGACRGATGQEFAAKVADCLKSKLSRESKGSHIKKEVQHEEEHHDDFGYEQVFEFENDSGHW